MSLKDDLQKKLELSDSEMEHFLQSAGRYAGRNSDLGMQLFARGYMGNSDGSLSSFLNYKSYKHVSPIDQGIKLHVSTGDKVDDFNRCLSILLPELRRLGIEHKVIRPHIFTQAKDNNHPQAGKMVTIYCHDISFLKDLSPDAIDYLKEPTNVPVKTDAPMAGRLFGRYTMYADDYAIHPKTLEKEEVKRELNNWAPEWVKEIIGTMPSLEDVLSNCLPNQKGDFDPLKENPWFYAARVGDLKLMEHLLTNCKADIGEINYQGNTALHVAIQHQRFDICHYLIENAIDVRVRNKEEKTAMEYAEQSFKELLEPILQKAQTQTNELKRTNERVGDDVVSSIKNGALDIHKKASPEKRGIGYLHKAVNNGLEPVAIALIESGISLNEYDDLGRTPLHYAISNQNKSMTQLLLKAGADPDKRMWFEGETPAHLALKFNNQEMVHLLTRFGADLNKPNVSGVTVNDLLSGKQTLAKQEQKEVTAESIPFRFLVDSANKNIHFTDKGVHLPEAFLLKHKNNPVHIVTTVAREIGQQVGYDTKKPIPEYFQLDEFAMKLVGRKNINAYLQQLKGDGAKDIQNRIDRIALLPDPDEKKVNDYIHAAKEQIPALIQKMDHDLSF